MVWHDSFFYLKPMKIFKIIKAVSFAVLFCAFMLTEVCAAAASQWRLFVREGGCVAIEPLARRYGLATTPDTPEEFASMMREKGHSVTLALPDGFGSEFDGSVTGALIDNDKRPIFVKAEICDALRN